VSDLVLSKILDVNKPVWLSIASHIGSPTLVRRGSSVWWNMR